MKPKSKLKSKLKSKNILSAAVIFNMIAAQASGPVFAYPTHAKSWDESDLKPLRKSSVKKKANAAQIMKKMYKADPALKRSKEEMLLGAYRVMIIS